eukprot:gene3315-6565_t
MECPSNAKKNGNFINSENVDGFSVLVPKINGKPNRKRFKHEKITGGISARF